MPTRRVLDRRVAAMPSGGSRVPPTCSSKATARVPSGRVERLALAAPMTQPLLLDAATHVVDALRRQADGVEVVDHQRRRGEQVADGGGVALEGVDRSHLDLVGLPDRLRADPGSHHVTGSVCLGRRRAVGHGRGGRTPNRPRTRGRPRRRCRGPGRRADRSPAGPRSVGDARGAISVDVSDHELR